MKTNISKGNSKMGKVWNVSLVPVIDCPKGVPCAKECYAMKAFRMYPNVKQAWTDNSTFAKSDMQGFFDSIALQLSQAKKQPKFFRWHVAGDILSADYFAAMLGLANRFPSVKFLAFTKNYKAVNDVVCGASIPENLSIVFSAWPGMPLDNPYNFPVAYMQDGTENRANNAIECPGNCETCGMCWALKSINKDVVFNKH